MPYDSEDPDWAIFTLLNKQSKKTLLQLLEATWDLLDEPGRREVFGDWIWQYKRNTLTPEGHLQEVQYFYRDSINLAYFHPFEMNEHNYLNIPERTEVWFNRLADLLDMTCVLAEQGETELAVTCFKPLLKLVEEFPKGTIVFAGILHESQISARYDYRAVYERLTMPGGAYPTPCPRP